MINIKDILNKILIENNIEIAKDLEKIGVTILNEDGYMKSLYKILEDVSEAWDKIGDDFKKEWCE